MSDTNNSDWFLGFKSKYENIREVLKGMDEKEMCNALRQDTLPIKTKERNAIDEFISIWENNFDSYISIDLDYSEEPLETCTKYRCTINECGTTEYYPISLDILIDILDKKGKEINYNQRKSWNGVR